MLQAEANFLKYALNFFARRATANNARIVLAGWDFDGTEGKDLDDSEALVRLDKMTDDLIKQIEELVEVE